ncbi:MAG: peptidylprolyl isomerase [Fusobacteriaceae bacterium]|jgi:cyclophilin family peptidyl-prolyl cis-trans isomerase|nr:peptidylprolyl isomerase [Fusobacteriaceae bacterium]
MKKTCKVVVLLMLIFSLASFGAKKKKQSLRYNDIRCTMVTTQGTLSFFLYPEAAPVTVASFINLGKRGFYNNNKVHRAIDNFVIQAGDPTETGRGGPGYTVPDEIVNWLDFFQPGMLAMANAGPNTGGSQYFVTVSPAEWLNGRHTVFGETEGDQDMEVLRKLEFGDIIKEVRFSANADAYLSLHKDRIDQWNKTLDKQFPNLKKYPVRPATPSAKAAYEAELKAIYAAKPKKQVKEPFVAKTLKKIEGKVSGDDKKAKEAAAEQEKVDALKSDLDELKGKAAAVKKR